MSRWVRELGASRRALHEVGNLLTQVSVSAECLAELDGSARGKALRALAERLDRHSGDPELTRAAAYARALARRLDDENEQARAEVEALSEGVQRIVRFIRQSRPTLQSHAESFDGILLTVAEIVRDEVDVLDFAPFSRRKLVADADLVVQVLASVLVDVSRALPSSRRVRLGFDCDSTHAVLQFIHADASGDTTPLAARSPEIAGTSYEATLGVLGMLGVSANFRGASGVVVAFRSSFELLPERA